jgi:hypothetical protein
VLLVRGLADPSSVYAAEGTVAHTVSEWCRKQGVSAAKFRGQIMKVDDYAFTVDDEMIKSVDTFCNYVGELPGLPFYEQRVSYEPWVPAGFGTLDDGRLTDGLCIVTDFKHGKGIRVDAPHNTQLMLYGLGLYHRYRHLFDFDHFALGVVQPRRQHVDNWQISLKDLLKWADNVAKPIAAKALKPGAEIKAGEWCRFCPAKKTCQAYADMKLKTVSWAFDDLDGPAVAKAGSAVETYDFEDA